MMDFREVLIKAVLFAAPAWIINMSLNGIYVAKKYFPSLQAWDLPIDYGKNFYKQKTRILGNSTTWPGIMVAVIVGQVLGKIFDLSVDIALTYSIFVYAGHALGSFIKRRLKVDDGKYMPIIDHGDYIITTATVFMLLKLINYKTALIGIAITLLFHPVVTYFAYKAKLKKYPL